MNKLSVTRLEVLDGKQLQMLFEAVVKNLARIQIENM